MPENAKLPEHQKKVIIEMKEEEFDRLLRQALIEAVREDYAAILAEAEEPGLDE